MIRLSPSEVARYYATRVPDLPHRGNHWRGRCPLHQGKGYNLSVNPETGLWRCWSSCGRGGDIISFEMALSGSPWYEAVAEVEHIVGRGLLYRPANRFERRLLAERREREGRESREAELFRIAASSIADLILEDLPEAVPERFGPTQLLLSISRASRTDLLAIYRDWKDSEPELTAGLVFAGEQAWSRRCDDLARFITTLAGAKDAA